MRQSHQKVGGRDAREGETNERQSQHPARTERQRPNRDASSPDVARRSTFNADNEIRTLPFISLTALRCASVVLKTYKARQPGAEPDQFPCLEIASNREL